MAMVKTIPPTRVEDLPPEIQAQIAILEGPKPPGDFISDGATHAPNWLWVPDSLVDPLSGKWVCTIAAGVCHDWTYSVRCTEIPDSDEGKAQADELLRQNLLALGLLNVQAAMFYKAVEEWGSSHFKVDG